MIAIIDYGMGNLRSVHKGVEKVGGKAFITSDPKQIEDADGVVLPGVGAFGRCMENLEKYKLIEIVKRAAASGKPFLGICLGLQLLFEESEEFGPVKGLGVLRGKVARFPESNDLTVPQMGWNRVNKQGDPKLLKGVEDGAWFYFVHSYYVAPEEKQLVATTTEYGINYASAVEKGNLFACQFHPEKSSTAGLQLLKNFTELVESGAK